MKFKLNVLSSFLLFYLGFVVLISVALPSKDRKSYDGYKLFRVTPQTNHDVTALRKWMIDDTALDFWQEPHGIGHLVEILVSPQDVERLATRLADMDIQFQISEKNLQKELNEMWMKIDCRSTDLKNIDLEDFNQWSEIMVWLNQLVAMCPTGVICETYGIGSTYEGRELRIFKISKAEAGRRAYWLDSTIHAREWLSTATLLKIMDHFVHQYGMDETVTRLVDGYDWYFLPVMNPDGYVYSWSVDRMWRKNRTPNAESLCGGTDLNRNFDIRWGTSGVSRDPCSQNYCGTSAASELETRAVQNEILAIGADVRAWFTMHTYGNLWLHPWGYLDPPEGVAPDDCTFAEDEADQLDVSNVGADAIEMVYNTTWIRGNSCVQIYPTSGGARDYAKGMGGIKYGVALELRGDSFIISNTEIEPSFREVWAGVVAAVDRIAEKHGP